MEQAMAFAPGNISCVFKIIPHEHPTKMHSLGMGFTVKEGAVVTVSQVHRCEELRGTKQTNLIGINSAIVPRLCRDKLRHCAKPSRTSGQKMEDSQTTVLFNGNETRFPTVMSVVQKLTSQPMYSERSGEGKRLFVEIVSPLPLGCGFGLSGASALATAYAVNALLGLGKSEEELAMTAHVAEVENLTGLGDVCAQYHGGCLVKLQVGHPLSAERLPVQEQPIYYRYFGPIRTKDVLRNVEQRDCINSAADKALREIKELMKSNSINFNACIEVSKSFALNSELLRDRRVQQVIQQIEDDKGFASMIMLGNAVFSTQSFEGAKETMLSNQKSKVL